MATPAQIAANRANANSSTGPRTEAGKANSSKNAIRHGLCSYIHSITIEDQDEQRKLMADLMDEHQPQSPSEEILVYKMAEDFILMTRQHVSGPPHCGQWQRRR